MYEEHPDFHSPPSEAVLWRYMDFTKYVSLLSKRALFFASADKLGDPFEGSYSKANIAMRPELYKDKIPEEILEKLADFAHVSRRFTMISCWHWSDYESAAMWKLYSRESDGIAIKTDFQSLSKSFTGEDSIYIGTVNYVDYDTFFIPERNMMSPYLHKRKSFEPEREVRALTIDSQTLEELEKIGFSESEAVYSVGKYQSVDLSVLISEIVVAPFAEDWFLELVASVADRYDLQAPVKKSSLAEEPVWK